MATTEKGIYYPADYDEVADIPDDMKKMAESIDDVIEHDRDAVDEFVEETNQKIETIQAEQTTQNEGIQENTDNIQALETKHDTEVAQLNEKIADLQEEVDMASDLIPTGDESGSNITLSDSARYKFKKIVLGGKSEQETFTGKNKFYFPNTNSRTISGVTLNYESNTSEVIASGTATGTISDSFSTEPIILEAGTYTASTIGLNVISTNADRIFLKNNDTSDIIVNSIKDATPQTFTLTETTNVVPVFIVASGSAYSNKEIKIQIEEGSTATDYEPYTGGQPAPNPDYECPIQNVGNNVNIFDKSSTPLYKDQTSTEEIENGVRVITQNTGTYHIALYLLGTVTSLKGKEITVSANIVPSSSNLGGLGIMECDADGSNRTAIAQKNSITGKQTLTAKIDESYDDNKVIALRLYSNLASAAAGDYVDYEELKVEEGAEATPYSPYNCGNVEVKVENKNIFDITKRLLGTIDENGDLVIDGTTRKFYEDNFEENTQYTLSGYVKSPSGTVRFKLVYTDGSSTDLVLYNNTNEYKYMTFTTPQNRTLDYIRMDYGNTGKMYIKNAELMIEQGSTATDYIAHEEQTAIFPLEEGQILHEGDTIEDKIVQKRKTLVFDGTENWKANGSFSLNDKQYYRYVSLSIKDNKKQGKALSNYFAVSLNSGAPGLYSGASLNFIVEGIENEADWKAWVAEQYANGTPLTLEYELAEPLEIPFTQAQATAKAQIDKLYSYKGTTHITSNANLDVTYRKDPNIRDTRLDALEARVALLEG